jgi:hypothetical protein
VDLRFEDVGFHFVLPTYRSGDRTRRIPTSKFLASELNAWQKERNRTASQAIWHFTTQDARIKLKHLYPVFEDVESDNSNALIKA